MNEPAKLQQIRDLARAKMMELPPFSGEEMNLLQTDPHRDGFVEGERTLAAQILELLDHTNNMTDPVDQEMVLGR